MSMINDLNTKNTVSIALSLLFALAAYRQILQCMCHVCVSFTTWFHVFKRV